jgi:uncharacterized protein YkwD
MFMLTACSRGGPAADPPPVMTIEASASADSLLSGSAGMATAPPLPCDTAQDENTEAFALEVIELADLERGKVDAGPLTAQAQLTQAAQVHALDMACNLFVSHSGTDGSSPFDRMTRFGYAFSAAAENVAAGYATPAEVVQGWMDSPGHRENVLNPAYTQIGVGYVFNSDAGADENYHHYWVMTLGKPQ